MNITKMSLRRFGEFWLSDGQTEVCVENLLLYKEDGSLIRIPEGNIKSCWLVLDGHYEIKKRLKDDFTRGEVFARRGSKSGSYSVYFPYKAIVSQSLGTDKVAGEEYIVTYDNYLLNITDLAIIRDTCYNIVKYDDTRVKVSIPVNWEESDQTKYLNSLCDEIKENCGIELNRYFLSEILKKYTIERRH